MCTGATEIGMIPRAPREPLQYVQFRNAWVLYFKTLKIARRGSYFGTFLQQATKTLVTSTRGKTDGTGGDQG